MNRPWWFNEMRRLADMIELDELLAGGVSVTRIPKMLRIAARLNDPRTAWVVTNRAAIWFQPTCLPVITSRAESLAQRLNREVERTIP